MSRSEHVYTTDLEGDDSGRHRLRVRFETRGNDVLSFVLQYETLMDEEWHPVVRYDTSHGEAHRDTYDPVGVQVAKEWLGVTEPPFNALLTSRYIELQREWPRHYQAFLARRRSRS